MPTEPPPPPARPGSDAAPIADACDRFAPPDEAASEAEREAFARSKLEIARTDPRRSPAEREAAAAELERRLESPHPPDGGSPVS